MTDQLTVWVEAIMTMPLFFPLVSFLVAIDSLIPLIPSETVLNLAGAWSGARGQPDLVQVFIWAVIGGVIGDNICYFAGSKMIRFVDRLSPDSAGGKAVGWVRKNMRRRAGATIIAARFIPWGRWVTTIILGSVRYPWFMFVFFDTIGVMVWAVQCILIGYLGGLLFQQFPLVGLIVGVVLGSVLGLLIQRGQNKFFEWRDEKRGFAEA